MRHPDPAHQQVSQLSSEHAQSYTEEVSSSLSALLSWADTKYYGTSSTPAQSDSDGIPAQAAEAGLETASTSTTAKSKSTAVPALVHADKASAHPWLAKLTPSLESWAAQGHLGNFVMTRGEDPKKVWEAMPIYVRLGMHLVFCTFHSAVSNSYIESQFNSQTIRSGKQFDSEEGAQEHIDSFIYIYNLQNTLQELREPDPKKYRTFNDFFTRKLKVGARPVDGLHDHSIITSAADCRLTCFNHVKAATTFWIKSRAFTLESLIMDETISNLPEFSDEASLAIFRLAPSDYHRFVSPVTARFVSCKKLPGQYYTVNPQAINMDVPVYTANRRDVALLRMKKPDGTEIPIVFVAVGALLVGSVVWTVKEGDYVGKGQELGYFAYGGSTCIAIFPKDTIAFDQDLINNSTHSVMPVETQIKCGQQMARFL